MSGIEHPNHMVEQEHATRSLSHRLFIGAVCMTLCNLFAIPKAESGMCRSIEKRDPA
jgi:hypothetical protein